MRHVVEREDRESEDPERISDREITDILPSEEDELEEQTEKRGEAAAGIAGGQPMVGECRRISWKQKIMGIPMIGIILAMISALLFCLCNVIVQKVEDLDPFNIALYRFIGISLLSFPVFVYRSEEYPRGKMTILILRSVLGSSNLIIHFFALKHMPMADANMIAAASPIWCVIFSRIFLREKLNLFDFFNFTITFIGIVFIIRPPFLFGVEQGGVYSDMYLYSALALAGGSLLQANVYILLRMLKGVHYSVTLSAFGSIGAVESAIFVLFFGQGCVPQCGFDRWMMMMIGMVSFVAQMCLTVSLQTEEAGKISIVRKAGDILFAFIFQITLFSKIPGLWSILGAVLIGSAISISSAKKLIDNLPTNHIIKKRYLKMFYSTEGALNPAAAAEIHNLVKSTEPRPEQEETEPEKR